MKLGKFVCRVPSSLHSVLSMKSPRVGIKIKDLGLGAFHTITHRIHGAAIYGDMDPINIYTPVMLADKKTAAAGSVMRYDIF